MELRVLGPVEARVDDRPVAIGAGKPRALLAMLGLSAGAAVPVERLIDGLWGEEPPPTAPKMVQVYVSQLRKSLAASGNGAEILTRGRGYELRLADGDVDARRFEQLVAEGRPRDALALWRGPPLDDVATEPFAALEIRRLEEIRLAAAELAIEQDLAAGRHSEVVPELEALVAQEPLRERLHGQRMLALYRCGRQADALAAYRRARAALVDAVGVEPGPELRRLHDEILRQDPSLGLPDTTIAKRQAETARRLSASAERAAGERARQRAAEDDLAGDVVELQAAWEGGEPPDAGVVACPFKGLASFDADDAPFFFGRERLVAEMVARLPGASLLGIIGPSGSGKSSALRAGLLPALANGVLPGSDRWAIALLRPGEHPLGAFEAAVGGAPRDGRLVVAVDQFEEVFTACRDEAERAAFADALVTAVRDPRRRAVVLIALRADFYGRCASFPELWRMLAGNHIPVGPMRRDELRRAIESPARRAGLQVDPQLVDALIADVEGEPGALPLLSTSLLELWQQRDGRRLTMTAYEHAGGVDGAVARMAERAYERLAPEQRPVAKAILLRMAGVGEGDAVVRRRVPLADLEGTAAVLGALADDRLVTIREGEAEVAHEALLREWPRLRGWLEEDAQGRRLHHHLGIAAREWDAGGRDPGELYRGARLAAALDWAAARDDELDADERAFVDESRAASERSHRRLRAVLIGVGALLLVAVIAGVVALGQRGSAREQATAADAQRLGSRALAENDLDRSLLLARQGVALDDSPQTRGNLLAALIKSPAAVGVLRGVGERMSALALSPDGRTLAAGDLAGNVFLFDTRTRRRVRAPEVHPGNWSIVQLAFSPDGRWLAIAHDSYDGHLVTLMDTRTRRMGPRLELYDYDRAITGVRFEGDAAVDVASRPDGTGASPRSIVERFEVASGRRTLGPVTLGPPQASPLLGTRDGRHVLTVSDEQLVVRDARTLKPVARVDIGPARGDRNAGAIALSPDDRIAAVGEADGSLRFVDLRTGEVRRASGRHGGAVTGARFTPDGSSLVTTSDDGDAILWDVGAGAAAETLSGHASGVAALEVARDGRTLYTAGLDGSIFVWDLVGTRRLGRPIEAGGANRTRVALSSDGRRLAIGQQDGAISVVDLGEAGPRRTFAVIPEGDEVTGVRFVPGGRLLIVTGPNLFAVLVDTDTGRIVGRLRSRETIGSGSETPPSVSADGRLVATLDFTAGGDTLDVVFWALPSGRQLGKPLRFDHAIVDAQLSPDGRLLALVLSDSDLEGGTVETWDVRRRRRVRSLRVAQLPGFASFSPDGRLFAIGNRSGVARVYETARFRPVTRALTGGEAGAIGSAAIARDNRTLVTGSDTGAVQLWDIPSGQALGAPLPGVRSTGVIPAFTPDGSHLVATYATGRAYVWDLRPRSLVDHACRVAGRRLTRAEWEEFLPGREYDPSC